MSKQAAYAIGVDIGGTHITCAAVDLLAGKLVENTLSRITHNHQADATTLLRCWAMALNDTLTKTGEAPLAGIGFAIPGPFDYRNGISNMKHKFPNLYGIHIPTGLNPLLTPKGNLPMRFLNDATAFAVGEAWQGAGKRLEKWWSLPWVRVSGPPS